MKITYYGQSCFSIETKGKIILTDPFITYNELAKDIDVDSIQADYIAVSHGHQDHIADLESIAKRTGAKLVSNFDQQHLVAGVWHYPFIHTKLYIPATNSWNHQAPGITSLLRWRKAPHR